MSDREMLTELDGQTLAAAFPTRHRAGAMLAGVDAARRLTPRQWTEWFTVEVEGETVSIPARLHFASDRPLLTETDGAWQYVRALQTRSNDGFQRQAAARDLLSGLKPWAAPFVVALIGEYIVEILDDIYAEMTPHVEKTLGTFLIRNEEYWATIKRRVTSYWNAYYRSDWGNDCRRAYRREEYVGFAVTERLDMVAFGRDVLARG